MEALINFGVPILMLVATYFIGTEMERRHYRSLRQREHNSRRFLAVTFPHSPPDQEVVEAELMMGNVVISVDYFKRFLAGLRQLVGGRVRSYETLMDRGRREAVMRLKEAARARGFHAVVNIRLETSRLASSQRNEGLAGVEVLAFGTALKFTN